MFIEQPAIYLRWLYPKAYWRMDRHEKAVYLTFDDGPIPEATPFILDTLKEFGIKATFFMVGDNVRKYPALYERIVAEGHQVGNHTHNHIQGLTHSIKEYSYNVEKANAYIHSHYVRPPHGWMRMTQYAWLSRKYKIVMWDLVTRDYSKWMTAEDVVDDSRGCGSKRETLHPQRLHHHIPRFPEVNRQTKDSPPRVSELAAR